MNLADIEQVSWERESIRLQRLRLHTHQTPDNKTIKTIKAERQNAQTAERSPPSCPKHVHNNIHGELRNLLVWLEILSHLFECYHAGFNVLTWSLIRANSWNDKWMIQTDGAQKQPCFFHLLHIFLSFIFRKGKARMGFHWIIRILEEFFCLFFFYTF